MVNTSSTCARLSRDQFEQALKLEKNYQVARYALLSLKRQIQ